MNIRINKELERIRIENFIWLIFFFLIGFNLYSNYLEENYLKTNDPNLKKKFREINCTVLTISLIIYIYFLIISWQDLQNLGNIKNQQKIKLSTYSFIASLLFVLGGILTLYVAFNIGSIYNDNEIAI